MHWSIVSIECCLNVPSVTMEWLQYSCKLESTKLQNYIAYVDTLSWAKHLLLSIFLLVVFLKALFPVLYFLPARRYASTGNSDRNVSVRLSVRPSRAGIVSKRRKLAA